MGASTDVFFVNWQDINLSGENKNPGSLGGTPGGVTGTGTVISDRATEATGTITLLLIMYQKPR